MPMTGGDDVCSHGPPDEGLTNVLLMKRMPPFIASNHRTRLAIPYCSFVERPLLVAMIWRNATRI